MLKVSVALATYNGARFLREQLASLATQTMLPAELVVSDDGSTDDTLAVVRDFAKTAPFPVVIVPKAERLGFSDNFLHAAEACRYDLVAFCDQDDVWLPRKIELGTQRVRDDASLMALHTLTVTDEALRPTGLQWVQEIVADRAYEPLELDPYITGWGNSMMFRRELVHLFPREQRPRQPERPQLPLSHDTWVYMLAAALGRVSHITAPLILYRQHGSNAEGVAAMTTWHKLLTMGTIPITRFREQALINKRMAELFEEFSRKPGPFADAARTAADRFEKRRVRLLARIGVFEGGSVVSRFESYRTAQRLTEGPRPWIGSRAKDLVFGVARLRTLRR